MFKRAAGGNSHAALLPVLRPFPAAKAFVRFFFRGDITPLPVIYKIMDYFDERAVMLGKYIAETGDTVRGAAKKFGVAKSTVHKAVTERLARVNASLALEVQGVLMRNLAERHLRGGEATRLRYARGANG